MFVNCTYAFRWKKQQLNVNYYLIVLTKVSFPDNARAQDLKSFHRQSFAERLSLKKKTARFRPFRLNVLNSTPWRFSDTQ